MPEVVGIDLSPEHIRLASRTADLMGLTNADFRVERIEELSFGDEEFDGVCFGGNQGAIHLVQRAIYSGENRALAADEFPRLLWETGFGEVTSVALPDATLFARSLAESGCLSRLEDQDLIPYLRALVVSAARCSGWVHNWVVCQKRHS